MGRKTKRGTRGEAAKHVTRSSALKKLQLSLADFRRLCIFKGVYPRDPKKKLKGRDKTYYHSKDIIYLWHEPLLNKFRDLKVHERKVKRALGRGEKLIARGLVKRKPAYALFHIVKERYPTLVDCLRDLDDALSSIALFASLPTDTDKGVTANVIADATRLFDEFLLFAVHQRLVRKVFCTIKGFYIQLNYLGQLITFLIPHQFPQDLPPDVDFKVLLTFLEFYRCVMKSVNFKVYQVEGLAYPPKANYRMLKDGCRFLALSTKPIESVNHMKKKEEPTNEKVTNETVNQAKVDSERLKSKLESIKEKFSATAKEDEVDDEEEDQIENDGDDEFVDDNKSMHELTAEEQKLRLLFEDKIFFISREVPRVPVAFLLLSCGASVVGWEGDNSPISEESETITHHICDRPITSDIISKWESKRELIQPQWVFDSLNSRVCLPVSPYKCGIPPPPHLSPFVDDLKEGYIPEQRIVLQELTDELKRQKLDNENSNSDSDEDTDLEEDIDVIEAEETLHQQQIEEEIGGKEKERISKEITTKIINKNTEGKNQLKPNKKKQKEIDERDRRKELLSKKHKRLLTRIEHGKQKASDKVAKLHAKKAVAPN